MSSIGLIIAYGFGSSNSQPSFGVALSHIKKDIAPKTMSQHSNVYEGNSTKFAIMVSNVEHFKAALVTADQMYKCSQNFIIQIIVIGELVKAIAGDQALFEEINNAYEIGVQLIVCEIAMATNKIPKKLLDSRIATIRNGWIYMFELKDKGFNTLST